VNRDYQEAMRGDCIVLRKKRWPRDLESSAHFSFVRDLIFSGKIVPFLGAGVNLCDRIEGSKFEANGLQLPSGSEPTDRLAKKLYYPENDVKDLVSVSRYVTMGMPADVASYVDYGGTSMAAPRVSGAAAAFLSIRNEFIGRFDEVKRIFVNTATSPGRESYFQGAGLVDLMRAIQSV
jgi:subtilisin family serine protease